MIFMKLEMPAVVESLGIEKFRRHIFLCADATEPKCCPREARLAVVGIFEAAAQGIGSRRPGTAGLSHQGQLPARVYARAGRGRLSRRRLVSLLHAGSAGARDPGTSDRRENCRGICLCQKPAVMISPGFCSENSIHFFLDFRSFGAQSQFSFRGNMARLADQNSRVWKTGRLNCVSASIISGATRPAISPLIIPRYPSTIANWRCRTTV